jgi:hypothetical protein
MPALELGAVIEGNVEQLGLVGVADIAGIGSQARLVRLAVADDREARAENVLVVVPTRQKQLQAADE